MKIEKSIGILLCLIVTCSLLSNCLIYAAEDLSPLAQQVDKYTSNFDEKEIDQLFIDGQYEKAKLYIQRAQESSHERWSLKGLTENDLYIAYQFKEYMSEGFFSQGWWAKITTWVSALFYNDELKDYLTLKSPGKEKYKDMLRLYISQTEEEMACNEYAQEIISALESIENLKAVLNEEYYNKLVIASKEGKREIDKVLGDILKNNPEIMENEKFINSLASKLSSILKAAGYTMEIVSSSAELISNIEFISAKFSVYDKYKDFLLNIQTTKNKEDNFVAPEDLRLAAYEINEELQENYLYIISNFVDEIAYTVTDGVVDFLGLIESNLFTQIMIGIDIATFIGNVSLDMSGLVKGISYVQGYAYIGEIYSIVLNKDKEKFIRQKNHENAMKFVEDYGILLSIRQSGEEAYLDMSDFSGTWKKEDRKCLQKWTDYEEKKNFCDDNKEMIESFKFIMPKLLDNETIDEQNKEVTLGREINEYLSLIYSCGIRSFDINNVDWNDMGIFLLYYFGIKYDKELDNGYFYVDEVEVNNTLMNYFNLHAPKKSFGNITYENGKYRFTNGDYAQIGMPLLIVSNVEKNGKEYYLTFDVAYVWSEDFESGEENLIEDWDIYYDYNTEKLMNDKFCEIMGQGKAILNESMQIKEFHVTRYINSVSSYVVGILCEADDGHIVVKMKEPIMIYDDDKNCVISDEIGLGGWKEEYYSYMDKIVEINGAIIAAHTQYHYRPIMIIAEQVISRE